MNLIKINVIIIKINYKVKFRNLMCVVSTVAKHMSFYLINKCY